MISYSLNVALLLLFAERMFRWYRSNRSSIVILLYGISAVALAVTAVSAIIGDFRNLLLKDPVVTALTPAVYPALEPGTLTTILSDTYHYADITSTLLVWGSTVLLLHHYSSRLTKSGKTKYWILITIPIVYYLSSQVGFLDLYVADSLSEAFYFYLFISLNSTAAAILFGLAFRIVAKSMRYNSAIREYIMISAFGFVLLFISNQSTLIVSPYPPFGFISVCFMGLSAYLIYLGIYSAAISMSEDVKLRQLIRRSAIKESKLLISIGAAQIQQQLVKKVIKDAKDRAESVTRETGVQLSLTERDMRQYLDVVLREIKVLQNVDEIIKKGKEILDTSIEFLGCLRSSGLRLAYNNYFDVYEKAVEKYRKGEHNGIKLVTSINKDNMDILKPFMDIGVEIRHVKNLPPIDFAVSDTEMMATIQKTEGGQVIQNLLVSNEAAYLDHFVSMFEELWKSGIEARSRIDAIEEGVDSEGIEIIQNPIEIQNLGYSLVKSANNEILIVFASARSLHSKEDKLKTAGLIELLIEAITQRGVKVRIVAPKDDFIEESLHRLLQVVGELTVQHGEQRDERDDLVIIRYVEPHLQTKVSVLVVDRKFSLAVEQKEETRHGSVYGVVGLATYSNSKATVLSYASIFETLWKQTEMYEQLQIHDRMQKEFINIAAHELRNPIQPLVLSSESLKGSMPDEERVSIVIRNAKKLQTLANEILDITKIESKTLKLNKEIVDVNEIIVYGIKDLLSHPAIAEGKVNLIYEPKKEDIFVEADRDRLGQVISNLLNNSLKFTDEGNISIMVQKSLDADEVAVSIKDTGSGIDPEILPRLFSKFVTKSDAGGTGLGLFISKSIVEAHGGRIWAENNRGEKGATFTFSLPASSSSTPLPSPVSTSTLPSKVNSA